jgi:DNA-binding transcriptional ArsR family regulator
MSTRRPPRLVHNPRALEAVASPVRQEILSALGHGPATVRRLSARLGRSRQALYYHLGLLARAGLARVTGEEGTGRDRERVYALAVERVAVGARAGSARERATADRAVGAMLRLTAREVRAAIESRSPRSTGSRRELIALRAKARLAPADLARLNARIDLVTNLLVAARARPNRGRLFSITVVLTPSRDSVAPARRPRGVNR